MSHNRRLEPARYSGLCPLTIAAQPGRKATQANLPISPLRTPHTDPNLDLVVTRDGSSVRVAHGTSSSLFLSSDLAGFLRSIQDSVAQITLPTDLLPRAESTALRVRIALHWARYHLAVGSEVLLQAEDLDHPQTGELVLHAAEAHHGKQTPAAWALAARMAGIPENDLRRWASVEANRRARM